MLRNSPAMKFIKLYLHSGFWLLVWAHIEIKEYDLSGRRFQLNTNSPKTPTKSSMSE